MAEALELAAASTRGERGQATLAATGAGTPVPEIPLQARRLIRG